MPATSAQSGKTQSGTTQSGTPAKPVIPTVTALSGTSAEPVIPNVTALSGAPAVQEAPREMTTAVLRGWRRRCPNCGSGPMLRGYLKVRDTCPVCGEALHHHRADDGPPYLTLLIVGHIIGPGMLWAYMTWEPDPFTFMAIFMVASVALSLFFLPRLKGVMVGVQWASRMGGFGRGSAATDLGS